MPDREDNQLPNGVDEYRDVAREIGKKQRNREIRIAVWNFAIGILLVLLLAAFMLGARAEFRGLLHDLEEQNEIANEAIVEARIAQTREAEQLERILAGIESRLVPREDIIRLQSEVEALQEDVANLERTNRELVRAVNGLTAALSRSRLGGG